LLTCHTLLKNIAGGLLSEQIAILQKRVEKLLTLDKSAARNILDSVKLVPIAARSHRLPELFKTVVSALFDSRQLHIRYSARNSGQISERDISAQTLVYYRDNWYVDAWCHTRHELRTFAFERIQDAVLLKAAAKKIERDLLDAHFSASYGIFPGPAAHRAVLKFSPERARWVSEEHWHADQTGCFLEDGSYELTIPFGDHRELIMDILKHGRHVEVLAPDFLRQLVLEEIQSMQAFYEKNFSE
jgi:proteasome accessory factor C